MSPLKPFTYNLLLLLSFLCGPSLVAQEFQSQEIKPIVEGLERKRSEISSLQNELRTGDAAGREELILDSLRELESEISGLEANLSEIITSVPESDFLQSSKSSEPNVVEEALELLDPLLKEIKRVTSRPRQISKLKSDIERDTQRMEWANTAIRKLSDSAKETEDQEIISELARLEAQWKDRRQEVRTALAVSQQQLRQKVGEQKSFGETLQELSQVFFRSRGRNLATAFLAGILFWFLLRSFASQIHSWKRLDKYRSTLSLRVFNALLFLARIFGSLVVFLLVLFVNGDWVLLALSLTLVVGFLWASRNTIPKVWNQVGLLLNVGAVREGERVVIDGVPYRVEKLNFYTSLTNPALDTPELRLPLKDMTELRSRADGESEPWFPSNIGDWVELSDGTRAEIMHQSAELVVVKPKGGSLTSYTTADYLALSPKNISAGFRIREALGLDYRYQDIITTDIPQKLKSELKEKLSERIPEDDFEVSVEFKQAGASSLDLAILVDVQGQHAASKEKLTRYTAKVCVDTATKYGWEIPFDQLTLHYPAGQNYSGGQSS